MHMPVLFESLHIVWTLEVLEHKYGTLSYTHVLMIWRAEMLLSWLSFVHTFENFVPGLCVVFYMLYSQYSIRSVIRACVHIFSYICHIQVHLDARKLRKHEEILNEILTTWTQFYQTSTFTRIQQL